MPFNTLTVACATTPTVISTFFEHYFGPATDGDTPFSHLSYREGVALVRKFLIYASHHTVEQLQNFTAQYVPHPTWVHTEDELVPEECISRAATCLIASLGRTTLQKIGGQRWWQWRTRSLAGEWVEMRSDYRHRLKHPEERLKTMLYIHGGAYFFGSVDEHRYQLQRHARKLHGRVFAPRYRLAPQFPFPCALHDALACYLLLLEKQEASTIVFAGDSAGGGLVLSLLTVLRDQGLPLPAGAVLISPWVDLCHSFPSAVGDSSRDYIPSHGFLHRPSTAWPPPTREELGALVQPQQQRLPSRGQASITSIEATIPASVPAEKDTSVTVVIDGVTIPLPDQLQMYTTNDLLAHPLVSPVNHATLGGLPPLLILVGGGEVLRDEQIYLAHKAAMPHRFPANPVHIESKSQEDRERDEGALDKYLPTKVMLQVYDNCCHVTPTLSFTRPAKFMYQSIAHFCTWALSTANDDLSIITNAGDDSPASSPSTSSPPPTGVTTTTASSSGAGGSTDSSPSTPSSGEIDYTTTPRIHISKASSSIPPFDHITNMIRQRVSHSGNVYDLPPIPDPNSPPASPHIYIAPLLHPTPLIGVITAEPVRRWLEGKRAWDARYARDTRRVAARRARLHSQILPQLNAAHQGEVGDQELPPPSALYGRTIHVFEERKEAKKEERRNKHGKGSNLALGLWTWTWIGQKHDASTLAREKQQLHKEKTQRVQEKRGKKSTSSCPAIGTTGR